MATTAAKKKKAAAPTPAPASSGAGKSNTLQVADDGRKSQERLRADMAAEGLIGNALMVKAFSQKMFGELDLTESARSLRDMAKTVHGGDLEPAEAMLLAQATSLNAIFCELARRSGLNMGEYLDAADRYMRLALKAQAQCRATLEALAEIKNPRPVAFVKQANIAHGPQQVNNSAAPGSSSSTRTSAPARTEETATPPNELLEAHQHGNFMDTGAPGTAGRAHQDLAAVGAKHRPAHA